MTDEGLWRVLGFARGGHDLRRGRNLLPHQPRRNTAAPMVSTRAMRLYAVDRTRTSVSVIVCATAGSTGVNTRTVTRPVVSARTAKVRVCWLGGSVIIRDSPLTKEIRRSAISRIRRRIVYPVSF